MRLPHALVPLVLGALACMGLPRASSTPQRLEQVPLERPPAPLPQVADAARLLEDLQRSPYWYVTATDDRGWSASLRTLAPDWSTDFSGAFLSEALSHGPISPPAGQVLGNGGLRRPEVVDLTVQIVFGTPREPFTTLPVEGPWQADVFARTSGQLDGNAFSRVALPLAEQVWLTVYEQGADPHRAATVEGLGAGFAQLRLLSTLPAGYLGAEVYAAFYDSFFPGLEGTGRVRYPGLQDRDTLGGVLVAAEGGSLQGLNIRVSHPEFCGGECTRDFRRLQKAEYCGRAIPAKDRVFFLIEDNAVFLRGEHDARYGTFTGEGPFTGRVEVLDSQGEVLDTYEGPFKGWQR